MALLTLGLARYRDPSLKYGIKPNSGPLNSLGKELKRAIATTQ